MSNGRQKLNFSSKGLYGIGRLADGIKISSFNIFLFFYFHQVLGLSGTLCGLAVFLALCVDAITDPMIGHLSDNCKSRFGRRHPFMMASLAPLTICFYLVFTPPTGLTQFQLFSWLLVFAVIVRVSISLFTIPHSALGAEISHDYHERSAIYGFSTFFGYFGGIGAAIIGYTLFFVPSDAQPNGLLNAASYPGYATWGACVMFLSIALCCWGTRRFIKSSLSKSHEEPKLPHPFHQDFAQALSNRSFRYLLFGSIIATIVVGTREALTLYMGTYYWELTSEEIATLLLSHLFGIFLAAVLVKPFHRRFDKKATLIGTTLAFIIISSLGTSLRLLGYFPENGSPILLPIILTGSLIATIFGIMSIITISSMIADVADEHELHNQTRREGIYFAAIAFAGKTASGFGHLFAGIAIDWIAFPKNAEPGAVSADILFRLGLFEGPMLGILGFVSSVLYLRYRIDRQRHADIVSQLQSRRLAAQSG